MKGEYECYDVSNSLRKHEGEKRKTEGERLS